MYWWSWSRFKKKVKKMPPGMSIHVEICVKSIFNIKSCWPAVIIDHGVDCQNQSISTPAVQIKTILVLQGSSELEMVTRTGFKNPNSILSVCKSYLFQPQPDPRLHHPSQSAAAPSKASPLSAVSTRRLRSSFSSKSLNRGADLVMLWSPLFTHLPC